MSFGNSIGFQAEGREIAWDLPCPGAIVAELTEDTDLLCAVEAGHHHGGARPHHRRLTASPSTSCSP